MRLLLKGVSAAAKLRLLAVVLGVVLLVGCGAGPGSSLDIGGENAPLPSTSALLVSLGNFGAKQIVSFQLTIDSVVLRSSNGEVSLLSSPRRFELSRLSLTLEPLLLHNVARGSYSSIVIRVSNPRISFIDSSSVLHEDVAASLTSSTATINAPVPIVSTATIFNLIALADSVTLGGGSSVTVAPRFEVFGPFVVQNGFGMVQGLVGRITAAGSTSLTVDVGNGSFNFAIDSTTEFQGVALGVLKTGMTVELDAVFYDDGTLRANRVELESDLANTVVVEGLTRSLSLAQMQILPREVHGPNGVALPEVGKVLTINTNASSQFHVEPNGIDLNNLGFTPAFDALTIAPGQNVRAMAASGSATTITAEHLKLRKQSVEGTGGALTAGSVSGQFSFPLTLAGDSAFAQLTGHTTVLVTLQPSTFVDIGDFSDPCITCISGNPVRVRGLLFFSGGEYRLVAETVAEN